MNKTLKYAYKVNRIKVAEDIVMKLRKLEEEFNKNPVVKKILQIII